MNKNSCLIRLWKNGKYVDLWSVVHFVAGMVLWYSVAFTGFSFFSCFIFAFILMVLWEFCEWLCKIQESIYNKITDIIIGLIGFIVANSLFVKFNYNNLLISFILLLFLLCVFNAWRRFAYKIKN